MEYSEPSVAASVIKEITSLKHFNISMLKCITDMYLETVKANLSDEQRRSLDKRIIDALGHLGYQVHLGIPQTVPTIRNM